MFKIEAFFVKFLAFAALTQAYLIFLELVIFLFKTYEEIKLDAYTENNVNSEKHKIYNK